MSGRRVRVPRAAAVCMAALALAGCTGDAGVAAVAGATRAGERTQSSNAGGAVMSDEGIAATARGVRRAGAEPDGPSGTVAVRLQRIEGYFVEGFELALRFETAAGEVVDALSWSDFVRSVEPDPPLRAYYESVLEQPVPAGTVVVLATVEIGEVAAAEVPPLDGELRCRASVDVPVGGRVEVEVRFAREDCLHVL